MEKITFTSLFVNNFVILHFYKIGAESGIKLTLIRISDGLSPKKSSPGRAQALNVKLGPGSSLSPSLKAGPRAGPGGLAGLSLLLINPKNIKGKIFEIYQNA